MKSSFFLGTIGAIGTQRRVQVCRDAFCQVGAIKEDRICNNDCKENQSSLKTNLQVGTCKNNNWSAWKISGLIILNFEATILGSAIGFYNAHS